MKIFIVLIALFLTGCQTKETQQRFMQANNATLECQRLAIAADEKRANQPPMMWKDERNALVYLVVQELAGSKRANLMSYCDDLAIAMAQGDAQKVSGILQTVRTLGGIGLGVIGLDVFGKRFGTGTSTNAGDTWNVSGSRVVNKSSSSSSSGDGLGVGNVFGGKTAQGGLEPRQFQNPDSASLEVNSGSLSGENAPIGLPVEQELPAPE